MKTRILTLAVFATSFTAFSQIKHEASIQGPKVMEELLLNPGTDVIKPSNSIGQEKAGDVIWSDDFSTSTNWTIDNAGATAPAGWNIGTTVNSWYFPTGITSTSGGNFAELNNGSDPNAPVMIGDTFSITAGPFDINNLSQVATGTATDNVAIQFEQYGARFYESQQVLVSVDGVNWDVVYTNDDKDIQSTTSGDVSYPNPELVSESLYPFIQGNAGSVYIRFQWSSQFPTDPTSTFWVAYGWFIDDVALVTAPGNDMELGESWHADVFLDWENSMRPMAQARELYPGVVVSNNGAAAGSVDVTCDISNGTSVVNTTTATSDVINPGETDTVWFTTGYTPMANAVYEFDFSIPTDDDNTNNNASAATLEINDFLMAHDYGATGSYGWNHTGANAAYANGEHGWGNIYVLTQAATAQAVDVVFATGTTTGISAIVNIWEVPDGNIQGTLNLIDQAFIDITAADIGNNVVTTIPLVNQPALAADMTYIVEVRREASTNETMLIRGSDVASEDDDFSTVGYGDYAADPTVGPLFFNSWGFSPYIRLNFEDQTSIVENDMLGLNIFPNPAVNNATVSFELNGEAAVNVTVTDLAGQVVYTNNLGNVAGAQNVEINTASMANGVYMVNVEANGAVSTQKLVVRK